MEITVHEEDGFKYEMVYNEDAEEHYVRIGSADELVKYMDWAEVIKEDDVEQFVGKWFITERGSMIEIDDEVKELLHLYE
jgi:hypothetical protein